MRPWLATCRCWHNNINNPNVPKPNLKTPRKQEPVRTPDHSRRHCLSFHQLFLQTLNLHRKGIATLSGSRLDLNLDCISVYQLYQRAPRQHLSLSQAFYVFVARFGCGKSCPGIAGPPKPFPPCLFPSSSDLHSPVSQSSIIQYPPQILHPQGCSSASPEVTASPGYIWTACCACCACAAKFCSGAFSRSGACKGNRM